MASPRFNLVVLILFVLLVAACVPAPSKLQVSPTSTAVPPATATVPLPASTLGKLAYAQNGNIWVKALPDGEALQLTTNGSNQAPRWSPSGEWLAFRKGDSQVWLIRSDGSDGHALENRAPVSTFAWAPADDRLAYVVGSGVLRLRVVNAGGTHPTTLVPPSEADLGSGQPGRIAWSPDGAWIAYEWRALQADAMYQGLWKVPAADGTPVELYASGVPQQGEITLAGWTDDGEFILFWQGEILSASLLADGAPLYALPAGGGEPTKLVDTMLLHPDFLDVSPDGQRLVVTAGGGRETWTHKRISVVELPTGASTPLTGEDMAAFSPAWSPDGAQIAYVAGPDIGFVGGGDEAKAGAARRRIWVMMSDGSAKRQLTDGPAYRDERPLWSADGSQILFARMDDQSRASMWLMPADGGAPQQVVDELSPIPSQASPWFGYYGHVDWDPLFDWWRGDTTTCWGVDFVLIGPE